ncbi:MAG: DUF1579 family protein [Myxococcales bacterium]|nr:DUF1579 family protein [Myxococcales bacterium]
MRRTMRHVIALAVVAWSALGAGGVCGGGGALAQTVAKPALELAKLDYFVGSWRCSGEVHRGKRVDKERALVSWVRTLDGVWLAARQRWVRKGGASAYRNVAHWGYDKHLRRYVLLGVDNLGGRDEAQSIGWQKDKLVWRGRATVKGKHDMRVRVTFLKQAKNELWLETAVRPAGSKRWQRLNSASCKREGR